MSWTHISNSGAQATSGSQTSLSATFPGTIAPGDLIVVSVAFLGPYVPTVQDTANTTNYTYSGPTPGTTQQIGTWYYTAISGGSSFEVTVTGNGASYLAMTIDAYSLTSGDVIGIDSNGYASGTSVTPTLSPALSVTTTDLVYAACIINGTAGAISAGTGFTMRHSASIIGGQSYGIAAEDYANQSSDITPGFSFADSTGWGLNAIAFKAVSQSVTIVGPSQGLYSAQQEFSLSLAGPAGAGGIVVTLASTNGSDTFQATSGGANITSITIPANSLSANFYLATSSTGIRNITITAGSVSCPNSPYAYDALGNATSYTVTGATGGHQLAAATWTVTLVGGDFSGTVTATPGGGVGQCQIFNPSTITFAGNGTLSNTFSFTPLDVDSVTYTFTNSGSLTNPSPKTYVSTGEYLVDTFAGTSGTAIQSHTSNTLPSGVAGSGYAAPSAGAISLDGSGGAYLSSSGTAQSASAAAMPGALPVEAIFKIERLTDVSGSVAGILIMADATHNLGFYYNGGGVLQWFQNNSNAGNYSTTIPSVGGSLLIKADVQFQPGSTGWVQLMAWSSTLASGGAVTASVTNGSATVNFSATPTGLAVNGFLLVNGDSSGGVYLVSAISGTQATISPAYGGTTNGSASWQSGTSWTQITDAGGPGTIPASSLPSSIAGGLYFGGTVNTASTGWHVSNLIVQDPAPAPPNCSIATTSPSGTAGAYISTSGQKAVFFFATGLSGGASNITPTAFNYSPSFFRGGTFIGVGTNAWCTGQNQCISVDLPPGVQVNPGDSITMSVRDSWVTLGLGNASAGGTGIAIANYSGMSCFGTNTLTKTFKPGFNFSDLGTTFGTRYNIPMNWRYRLPPAEAGSQNTVDGYPTVMYHQTETLTFLDLSTGNGIDSTEFPGVIGYWAVGFDDNYVANSGFPTTLTIVSGDTSKCTVTQVTGNNNPGSGGLNQYYLFNVQYASGSTSANTPLALQWYNASRTPYVSNLWIVGPGDFTVPSAGNTTWSFPRTNPYALSGQFLKRLANGAGSMRWADAWCYYGAESQMSEPWDMRNLTDFSWNNSSYNDYSVAYVSARPLSLTNSPYVYSEWIGTAYNLTLNTSVNATATSFSINAGGDAYAIPIAGLLLTMGTGEKCRIRSVSGTSNPYTCFVERGSSGTTAANQSPGTITCSSRKSMTGLSNFGGQLVELVTSSNHNLKTGMLVGFGGSGTWPTMTFADGSTNVLGGSNYTAMVTGPTTFAVDQRGASTPPTTLGSTYTLGPSSYNSQWQLPEPGFPIDFCAIVAGSFSGCHIHVNIPILASDSFCYAVAARLLANFPAGRKVYIELADEFWNFSQTELYQAATMDTLLDNGAPASQSIWYVVRSGQIRTVFKTAFGSRSNEIYLLINCFNQASGVQVNANIAIANGVTVDAWAIAPYVDPNDIPANVTAWNNSNTIQQMIDLWVHDLYYGTSQWAATFRAILPVITSYNSTTGGSSFLYGYEGGFQNGAPHSANDLTTLARDLPYDPNWLIIEQDFYALLQTSGFVNLNMYSYDIYYVGNDNWGVYHSPCQPYGKGDGSDGKANNRLCLATPGFTHTKAATTNQDQQNVSVRGQAFLEWMQPAQAKKRMLFVPYRFVNR